MSQTFAATKASFSITYTFWRTVAILGLFVILLINYRQLLLDNSSFSMMITHLRWQHFNNVSLMLDLGMFLTALIVLHLLWALTIAVSSIKAFSFSNNDNIKTQSWLLIVLLHLTLILGANSYFYPTSLLGFFRGTILAEPLLLISLSLVLIGLFLSGLYLQCGRVITISCTLLMVAVLLGNKMYPSFIRTSPLEQPNIIIIGIDGLRPDHLAYGGANTGHTPFLDRVLSQSVVFDRTYTPMARTYTAWLSLLTGQYPVTHGGRFNLAPPELIDRDIELLAKLKQRGYQTTYAMDERRFNQIDSEYGFDQVIGPKVGAADAIVSSFADFPLVNLIANTWLGKTIFPYLYLNRAYGKTYDPQLFNQEVTNSLSTTQANFLAVHFCMLHWPYTSKDFISISEQFWQGNYNHFMYQAMLNKLDRQIEDLIAKLKVQGQLDNAIVYFISDHGEGFQLKRDQLLQLHQENGQKQLNVNAWGHGTNVLNQPQASVLMAYSRYNNGEIVSPAARINGVFSLIDIVPSLYRELGLEFPTQSKAFDGQALPFTNQEINFQRMAFVESSIPVKSINTSFIDQKKVLSETQATYEIRANGRLVMRPDLFVSNVAKKQRSVYYKSWQLVMLPDYDDLVLVNTDLNQWSRLSLSTQDAPWQLMLSALCQQYKNDIGFDHLARCSSQ